MCDTFKLGHGSPEKLKARVFRNDKYTSGGNKKLLANLERQTKVMRICQLAQNGQKTFYLSMERIKQEED